MEEDTPKYHARLGTEFPDEELRNAIKHMWRYGYTPYYWKDQGDNKYGYSSENLNRLRIVVDDGMVTVTPIAGTREAEDDARRFCRDLQDCILLRQRSDVKENGAGADGSAADQSDEGKTHEFDLPEKKLRWMIRCLDYDPAVLLAQGQDIAVTTKAGSLLRIVVDGGTVSARLASRHRDDADEAVDDFFQALKHSITRYESEIAANARSARAMRATRPDDDGPAETTAKVDASPMPDASVPTSATDTASSVKRTFAAASSSVKSAVMMAMKHLPSLRIMVAAFLSSFFVFAVSVALGWQAGYASREPKKQPEYINMMSKKDKEIKQLRATLGDTEDMLDSSESMVDELRPYKDEYDKKKAELDQRQAELDSRSSSLDSRESVVKQRENALSSSSSSPSSAGTDASYGTQSGTSSGAPTGRSYYKNCKAVWNALGHGITSSDPGYSLDLDSDGDGRACEQKPNY